MRIPREKRSLEYQSGVSPSNTKTTISSYAFILCAKLIIASQYSIRPMEKMTREKGGVNSGEHVNWELWRLK